MDNKRKLVNEAIVAQALEEEEGRKRLKKANRSADGQQSAKKGLSLHEVEAAEGGVVKESLAGAAHQKRSLQRQRKGKGKAAGNETELLTHVEEAEEIADRDQDDGMKLEPFNLAQERQEGFFDESGHFVEHKPDDEDDKDAWLGSEDAAVVSDSVRQQILERERIAQAAEDAPEMTLLQTAAVQRDIASILLPGESVAKGLQRLGMHNKRPAGKRNKDSQTATTQTPEELQLAKEQFEKLTEAASMLIDSGETDVYSQKKELFEREAARFAAYDDDGDMFADNEENKPEKASTSTGPTFPSLLTGPRASFSFPDVALDSNGGTPRLHLSSTSQSPQHAQQEAAMHSATNGASGSSTFGREEINGHAENSTSDLTLTAEPSGPTGPIEAQVDYQSWPVKELRRFLSERGMDANGLLEKSELAQKVKEVASQGPEGQASASIPNGYIKDDVSGYYFNSENQMYFDAATNGFYSGVDGKWYLYDDVSQQFREWTQGS